MSMFVYISHRDVIEALLASRQLMEQGHYPFVPQLNKLIHGRTDTQWENYFKQWMFKCDCLFLTKTFRDHELAWAHEIKLPVCYSVHDVSNLKLPPFGELGRRFGEEVAKLLPENESWRQYPAEDEIKSFVNRVGLGSDPLTIGALALQAWDRRTNG